MPRQRRNGATYPIPYKTVKKLKDGSTRIYEGYHAKVDGHWVSAKSYDECDRKIKLALKEARQWGAISDRSVKLYDYAKEWLEGKKATIDPGSARRYMYIIENQLSKYPALRIADITPTVARRMVNNVRLKDGSEPAIRTMKSVYDVLKSILESAVADRIIPTNPMAALEAPHAKDTDGSVQDRESFTDDEVSRMLAVASTDVRSGAIQWWRLLTGMRQGEILGATLDQLEMHPIRVDGVVTQAGYYRVHWKLESVPSRHGCGEPNRKGEYPCGMKRPFHCPQRTWDIPVGFDMKPLIGARCLTPPKSKRDRLVPIPPLLGEMMRRYMDIIKDEPNPYGLIFHRRDGQPIRHSADLESFRNLMLAAGIPTPEKRYGHECRNTVVSKLVREGVDPGKVQRIIGHSSIAMMEYYRRVSDSELMSGMELLSDGLDLKQIEWQKNSHE